MNFNVIINGYYKYSNSMYFLRVKRCLCGAHSERLYKNYYTLAMFLMEIGENMVKYGIYKWDLGNSNSTFHL